MNRHTQTDRHMMGALRIPALPVQLSSTYKTDRYENKQRQ